MNLGLYLMTGLLCLLAWLPADARDLKIIFSAYTPPYVFDQGDGIVVDIVKASLEPAGYTITPVSVPIGRGFEMFAEKRVDGTAIIQESSGLAANYSDDFMQYHNFAFALKNRNLQISKFSDLMDKTIIGFQNAHKYLGPDFGNIILNNPNYKEIANQETQVLMLLLGRIDVIIMDESIFRFYREKLISEGKVTNDTAYQAFNIFPPSPYKTAFVDVKVRDDFNKGLARIRANGTYDGIYRRYIERYFEVKR